MQYQTYYIQRTENKDKIKETRNIKKEGKQKIRVATVYFFFILTSSFIS